MKNLGKLSYYYTLAAVTGLLIGSVFFVSPPFNYFQVALLSPAILFLFLNITHPENVSDSEWSARLFIVFIALAGVVVGGYYLSYSAKSTEREIASQMQEQQTKEDTIQKLSEEISTLKQELSDQKENQSSDESDNTDEPLDKQQVSDLLQYLGVNDEASSSTDGYTKIIGYVKLKNGNSETDVYKEDNASSRVIGIITSTTTYPFYQSKGEWYLIEFDASQKGWVKAQYVKEEAKQL